MADYAPETLASMRRMVGITRGSGTQEQPREVVFREQVYSGLVHNIFSETLSKTYPITKAWLQRDDENLWEQLVLDFIREGHPPSPQLWRMPEELIRYVRQGRYKSRPVLLDLLSFEWVEIEVFMAEDQPIVVPAPPSVQPGKWLVLNPVHRIITLEYPVFAGLGPEILSQRGKYLLACFRKSDSHEVRYLALSAEARELLLQMPIRYRKGDLIELFLNEGLVIVLSDSRHIG